MIDTPMWLDSLDDAHAVFVGLSEETRTVPTMIGPQEFESSYPRFVVQREVWEASGRPVVIHLEANVVQAGVDG